MAIYNRASNEARKIDPWFDTVKRFCETDRAPAGFIGHCCEHKEKKKEAKAMRGDAPTRSGFKNESKEELLALLEKGTLHHRGLARLLSMYPKGKTMDGFLHVPELRLLIPTDLAAVDLHALAAMKGTVGNLGYGAFYHGVIGHVSVVTCAEKGAYPRREIGEVARYERRIMTWPQLFADGENMHSNDYLVRKDHRC